MKKIIYLLIPVILVAIIVFGILKIFILGDLGKGALQVTSKPYSKVYLDNTYIGTTPLCRCEATNMLRSGEYTIRLVPLESKISEYQDKITITKGVLTVVDRKFGPGAMSEGSVISLQPITYKDKSELLVITFPDKSDVYLDTNYHGQSPLNIDSTTDSDHTIRVKKDGYKDKIVKIRTPSGFKLLAVIYLGLQDGTFTPPSVTQPSLTPTGPSTSITPSIAPGVKVTILQTPNGFLRVRSEPSLDSAEITRVKPGVTFLLLEEIEGWYKIELPDQESGWVSAQFAQKQ